jgi:hypothetical protein
MANDTTGNSNTATGEDSLFSNSTGNFNTAAGMEALRGNTTGYLNTAVGYRAGGPNSTGASNTFVGSNAGPATTAEVNNATAIGANAQVSVSNAVVLGASGTNVGVGTTSPNSRLQVGTPSTSYGDYLQLPIVTSTSAPPNTDCMNGSTIYAGRLVIQYDSTKVRTTLWTCSPTGVWARLAQGQ